MRWGLALVSATTVGACAAIAGLDAADRPGADTPPDGAPPLEADADAPPIADAGSDAEDGGPLAVKELDASCKQRAECISGNCTEQLRCATECKTETCNRNLKDCCVGYFCDNSAKCQRCVPDGIIPLFENHCCSKRVSSVLKACTSDP
ncbi:MAG: hypothetical protein KIT84_30330 [Labilithrix sp.]|nr:hypothetical protein [Labilithrix sp.]MCW5815363.1 hypothetical protein [Labilithrix sp.]